MNENLIKITKDLVKIPSYLSRDRNENEISKYLLDFLRNNCSWLKTVTQKVEKDRANILAFNSLSPRILFVCHMDTVKPSNSSRSMLNPRIQNGKLYGLGAADMKGGIASALVSIVESKAPEDVGIIFDCDEEYNFKGIKKVLNNIKLNPELVICPEPTDLKILNGCRGIVEIQLSVYGRTAHAGTPDEGINAIEKSVEAVEKLRSQLNIKSSPLLGKTTVNLSSLNGARNLDGRIVLQANAVADIANITLDIRPSQKDLDAKNIIKKIQEIARELEIKIGKIQVNLDYNSYYIEKNKLKKAIRSINSTGISIGFEKNLGSCGFLESALIANAWDCRAVSLGPSGTAHSSNEYVDIKSLEKSVDIYKSLISNY